MRVDLSLPRVVERGVTTTLTLPLVTDAGVETAVLTGAGLTIYLAGQTVLEVTTGITTTYPAEYEIDGGDTADLSLSSEWLEVWDTSEGKFNVSGHLVRTAYYSRVTDGSLQRVHPEVLDILPAGETTAEKFRVMAAEKIERALLNRGRRPWLVFDPSALYDAEVYLALHLWAQDAAMRTSGTSNFAQLSRDFWASYEREYDRVNFEHYDEDEDGLPGDPAGVAAEPPGIVLTAGRPRSLAYGGWR